MENHSVSAKLSSVPEAVAALQVAAPIRELPAHLTIDHVEESLLQHPEALIDLPLTHRFTPGLYIREIFNPAGTLLTTKVHKTEHPFVVLKGKISIWTPEEGGKVEHLCAPHIGITKAGTRRIIYAHEDTVFVTFHANPDDERDLEVIEDRVVERHELVDGRTGYELAQEIIHGRLLEAQQ